VSVVFDPDKDHANRQKHGLSLARAEEMDFETAVIVIDDRFAYGEARYQALGLIAGRLHMLVYTRRDGDRRAISLRKANRKERQRYDEKA
jgi:uncharacterized DUF497 family protein